MFSTSVAISLAFCHHPRKWANRGTAVTEIVAPTPLVRRCGTELACALSLRVHFWAVCLPVSTLSPKWRRLRTHIANSDSHVLPGWPFGACCWKQPCPTCGAALVALAPAHAAVAASLEAATALAGRAAGPQSADAGTAAAAAAAAVPYGGGQAHGTCDVTAGPSAMIVGTAAVGRRLARANRS